MIEVQEVRKSYGEQSAVDGVSFVADEGMVFGLLGPNGAGKSTTIGCISGLLAPSSGRIRVCGHDVIQEARKARSCIGVVPQELALYEDLSAADNASYWGAAYGLRGRELERRVGEVLELTGLADRAREAVKSLSGGMKRRLNFGCGIVHRPRVLLLDEPSVGVDPQSRVRLLDMVREQARAGTCVLFTTHYMEEAQALCDHLAIMDHGRILAAGTLEELRGLLGERDLLRLTGEFEPERTRNEIEALDDAEVVSIDSDTILIAAGAASRRLPAIFGMVAEAGGRVDETTLNRPNLESLFIKMTGRELRE